MSSTRLRTVALLALVVLVATPTAAAPPPQSACEPCGSGFSEAATWYGERYGVGNETATDVEHSTATVRVYENETAIWTVRNRLTSEQAIRFFRSRPTVLAEIGRDAEGYSGTTFLSARISGDDTVVLRYRSEKVSRTRGGVLRFDGFREVGTRRISELGADRLTVLGPSGTTITRGPSWATVRGNELTLTSYRDAGDGPFVTFAQSGGVVGEAWSFVSLAETLADDVVRNLLFDVLLPVGMLFALLVGFVRVSGKTVERNDETTHLLAGIVTALGVLSVLYGFSQTVSGGSLASGALVAGGAYTALALLTFADVRPSMPRVAVGVAVAWLFGVAVMAVAAVFASGGFPLNYYVVSNAMLASFSVLLLLSMAVVGYAVSDPRYRRTALALPPIMLAVALAVANPITHVRTPLDPFYSILFAVVALVVVSLFGIPAFLLGRTLPAEN